MAKPNQKSSPLSDEEPTRLPNPKSVVIQCDHRETVRDRIRTYADELRQNAPSIGSHGLEENEFWDSGLFHGAVERLRGQQAASMEAKKRFLGDILDHLGAEGAIQHWEFVGGGERHDYQITLNDGQTCVIEAKGCLDGNNTTIYQRPPNADTFLLWSLCQNPGADPRHNAWSGIHTRLGANIVANNELVDGLIIWDMLCGTAGRPCPKIEGNNARATQVSEDRVVPPPCIYLFPRTVPDPRNNPCPPAWTLDDIGLLRVLYDVFGCDETDVTQVCIEARMRKSDVQRRTSLERNGVVLARSRWTSIKRASR